MSRKAPTGKPATKVGWVYTLHLDPPFGDGPQVSKHYTGWAVDVAERLQVHAKGGPDAARLMQLQREAGGSFRLAALERGTRDRETQLKERAATRRCPICRAERDGAAAPVVLLPAPDPTSLSFPDARPLRRRRTAARRIPAGGQQTAGAKQQGRSSRLPVLTPGSTGYPGVAGAPAPGRGPRSRPACGLFSLTSREQDRFRLG